MPLREIPHYQQTSGFSCGAACLTMALHALKAVPVSRSTEYELWREANMIGIPGIDTWGLTIPALRRGVPATVITESETTFPIAGQAARKRFTEEQIELSQFAQAENRRAADALGARWDRRQPTIDDARSALARGGVPVLLVDLMLLTGSYEAPHWVIPARFNGREVIVHDPDPDGPGIHRIPPEQLWDSGDVTRYGAQRALVLLGP